MLSGFSFDEVTEYWTSASLQSNILSPYQNFSLMTNLWLLSFKINLIPFFLRGINIVFCQDKSSDIVHTVSLTMRRAGVAITVTSLTDFMVFAIGATTTLPALMSFCLWCAVGILAVYFFQVPT